MAIAAFKTLISITEPISSFSVLTILHFAKGLPVVLKLHLERTSLPGVDGFAVFVSLYCRFYLCFDVCDKKSCNSHKQRFCNSLFLLV